MKKNVNFRIDNFFIQPKRAVRLFQHRLWAVCRSVNAFWERVFLAHQIHQGFTRLLQKCTNKLLMLLTILQEFTLTKVPLFFSQESFIWRITFILIGFFDKYKTRFYLKEVERQLQSLYEVCQTACQRLNVFYSFLFFLEPNLTLTFQSFTSPEVSEQTPSASPSSSSSSSSSSSLPINTEVRDEDLRPTLAELQEEVLFCSCSSCSSCLLFFFLFFLFVFFLFLLFLLFSLFLCLWR